MAPLKLVIRNNKYLQHDLFVKANDTFNDIMNHYKKQGYSFEGPNNGNTYKTINQWLDEHHISPDDMTVPKDPTEKRKELEKEISKLPKAKEDKIFMLMTSENSKDDKMLKVIAYYTKKLFILNAIFYTIISQTDSIMTVDMETQTICYYSPLA